MAHSKEPEYGRIEFKYNLRKWTDNDVPDGAAQMNYRLMEGGGISYYKIGLTDSGIPLGIYDEDFEYTIEIIRKMAERLCASVTLIEKQESWIKITGILEQSLFKRSNNHLEIVDTEKQRFTGKILIKCDNMIEKAKVGLNVREVVASTETTSKGNLNICVLGNVDSSKSSLLGVLINGKLDDGRGSARSAILNYKHELITGRSTSIVYKYMIFDKLGKQIFDDVAVNHNHHVVTIFDTCGHSKYFKATARCIYSSYSDYCLVLIEAKVGITQMTREHIHLVSSSGKRLILLVTRTDICPQDALEKTRTQINGAFRRNKFLNISSEADISEYIKDTSTIPIIEISNVTGYNIDILRKLIYSLPILRNIGKDTDPLNVVIERTYNVRGIGRVISGYVKSGVCHVGSTVQIGPNRSGQYIKAGVKSIYHIYNPTEIAKHGQMCTFALSKVEKAPISRGMMMTTNSNLPVVRQFTARIKIIGRHSTSIKAGYEPSLTINNTDQVAIISNLVCTKRGVERDGESTDYLYEGDTGEATLSLKYFPMSLIVGDKFYLREGNSRGHGTVLSIL